MQPSHPRRAKDKKQRHRPTCAERQREEEKENHFALRGGERIKIGRVVFTVKELANEKYRYCCDESRPETENGGLESGVEF